MTVLATAQDPSTPASVPATSTTTPTPSAPAAPAAPPIPPDLAARMATLEKEAADARREAAKYRTRNDEETANKLKEQGDYKALWEKAQGDLDKAKRYDAWQQKEEARVEAEAAKLAPHEQLAIRKAATLEDRLELLQAFASARPSTPAAPPAAAHPPVGAPGAPAAPPLTLEGLASLSAKEFAAVEAQRPEEVKRVLASIPNNTPRPSTWREKR